LRPGQPGRCRPDCNRVATAARFPVGLPLARERRRRRQRSTEGSRPGGRARLGAPPLPPSASANGTYRVLGFRGGKFESSVLAGRRCSACPPAVTPSRRAARGIRLPLRCKLNRELRVASAAVAFVPPSCTHLGGPCTSGIEDPASCRRPCSQIPSLWLGCS